MSRAKWRKKNIIKINDSKYETALYIFGIYLCIYNCVLAGSNTEGASRAL